MSQTVGMNNYYAAPMPKRAMDHSSTITELTMIHIAANYMILLESIPGMPAAIRVCTR